MLKEKRASSVEISLFSLLLKTVKHLTKKPHCTTGKKTSGAFKTLIDLEWQPLKNIHFWIRMQLLQT